MYGKEASNRKQETDRQHHTIPNQRPKDKHRGKIKTFGFSHNADYYGIPLMPHIILYSTHKIWKIQVIAPTTEK